ncbi:hypothetical protein An16g07010 [Aspergillus niger]|uniref:Uncharacterized protein n=2 Tax=Aspergillus niger TaxID=5061 RepID=A2R8F9_ASPNC|nr:hypothetical protein An16g07010 [Aspergillus niger]CAK47021.1 hypothetical protein An16g07010 [Aspergillus niger]
MGICAQYGQAGGQEFNIPIARYTLYPLCKVLAQYSAACSGQKANLSDPFFDSDLDIYSGPRPTCEFTADTGVRVCAQCKLSKNKVRQSSFPACPFCMHTIWSIRYRESADSNRLSVSSGLCRRALTIAVCLKATPSASASFLFLLYKSARLVSLFASKRYGGSQPTPVYLDVAHHLRLQYHRSETSTAKPYSPQLAVLYSLFCSGHALPSSGLTNFAQLGEDLEASSSNPTKDKSAGGAVGEF